MPKNGLKAPTSHGHASHLQQAVASRSSIFFYLSSQEFSKGPYCDYEALFQPCPKLPPKKKAAENCGPATELEPAASRTSDGPGIPLPLKIFFGKYDNLDI